MSTDTNKILAPDVLDTSINVLGLTPRATHALIRGGYVKIRQLLSAEESQLLKLSGVGENALTAIRASLHALLGSVDDTGNVDWEGFAALCGADEPAVIPPHVTASGRTVQRLQLIPEAVKALPLSSLHLPRRIFNPLKRAEILTLKDLLAAQEKGLFHVERLGSQSIDLLEATLADLADSVEEMGDIDWPSFWARRGVTIIPRTYKIGSTPDQIISGLPIIIREILAEDGDDRDWKIIERRFGLNSSKRLTLEELGDALDLTRERIRQIEYKGLVELQSVLIEGQYIDKDYHVHPEVTTTIRTLLDIIAIQAHEFILETQLFELVEKTLAVGLAKVKPILILIFRIAGLERIEFDDPDLVPVWELTTTGQADILRRVVGKLDDLLTTEAAIPMDEIDILGRINRELPKSQKVTVVQLRRFTGLCSTIEQRSDGLFWAKFEFIKSRGAQIERLLSEAQKPLHVNEITRIINSRTVIFGKRKVNEANIGNIISSDKRFLPVGRTGQWKLKSWDHVETASVVDLMERFLLMENEPKTEAEILEYVRSLRPVSAKSVKMYLQGQSCLFRQVGRTRWGLASWPETHNATVWDRKEVCDFVVEYFRKLKVKEVEYNVLGKALASVAGVNEKVATGMLNWSPAVTTRRGDENKRYAVFQPDYLTNLDHKASVRSRKSSTVLERMHSRIREILEARRDFQITLSELVAILEKEFNCRDKTAYQYIQRADFTETFTVLGTRTRICRLKRASALQFPQIQNITDQNLRESIERAITDLTLDDVDIGLFQLGREFEVIIKKALGKGHAKGKVTLSQNLNKPQTQWKLVDMVDCAKQNGLITDLGVVNLLRQERNNRAHGGRPPLEERQALMNSAQYLAGLYIDYIILFDKYFQSLA